MGSTEKKTIGWEWSYPPCLVFLNSQKNATSDAAASDNGDDLEEDDDDFEKLK